MSSEEKDPVEAADDERDLYGVSSWERRSLLDSVSVAVYWFAVRAGQVLFVLLALSIFLAVGGPSANPSVRLRITTTPIATSSSDSGSCPLHIDGHHQGRFRRSVR